MKNISDENHILCTSGNESPKLNLVRASGEKKVFQYFGSAWIKKNGDRTVCHLGLRYEFAAHRGL